MLAVACATTITLLFTACSTAPEAADVNAEIKPPSGADAVELQVNFGDDVPDGEYVVTGARQRVELNQDGDAKLAFELDTPALLAAVDEKTGTTLSAISMPISDLEPVPVIIDWTSTAFTSWVTTAGWVTSDTGVMLVLRKLAQDSPNLDALAVALAADDTAAADSARAALSGDVIAALSAEAPAQPTASASADADATITTVAHNVAGDTRMVSTLGSTVPAAVNDADCVDSTAHTIGLCITADRDQATYGRKLDVASTAPTWTAAYAVDDNDVTGLPLALVGPVTYGGITVTSLIEDLGKSAWGALGTGACAVVSWFGSKCSDERKKSHEENLHAIVEQSWQVNGEATIYVREPDGPAARTAVITAGIADGGLPLSGTGVNSAQSLIYLLDGWSYLVKPTIELVLGAKDVKEKGDKVKEEKEKKAKKDTEKTDEEKAQEEEDAILARLERENARATALIDALGAVSGFDFMADMHDLVDADASELMAAGADTISAIGQAIINDRNLRNALVHYMWDEVITADRLDDLWDVAISTGLKALGKAVPVVGWVIAGADLAAQAAATAQQAGGFIAGVRTLPAATEVAPLWWDALAGEPALLAEYQDQVLRGWDYANGPLPNPGGAFSPVYGRVITTGLPPLQLQAGSGSGITFPENNMSSKVTLMRSLWPQVTASTGWLIVKEDPEFSGPTICRYPVSLRWLTPQIGTPWCEDMQTSPWASGYMRQYQWVVGHDGALLERIAPDDWTLDTRDEGWVPNPQYDWMDEAFGYAERSFTVRDGLPVMAELPMSNGDTWRTPDAVRVRAADLGVVSVAPPPCEDDEERVCDI